MTGAPDLSRLRRRPDVEDPTLLAHDATDELLIAQALLRVEAERLRGEQIVVLGERHGAITLSLVSAGLRGVRVVQDRLVHERSLDANAAELGLDPSSYAHVPAAAASFDGARLVLWQLPRSIAGVEHGARLLSSLAPGAAVVAGGRVKHLSVGMNAPLEALLGPVAPQRAERKSRLLLIERGDSPTVSSHEPSITAVTAGAQALRLAGSGEAFGGARLDPGTRLLLETLGADDAAGMARPSTVVDLGCGNGTLAVWAALRWPEARVEATDDSADAVASTALSAGLSGVGPRVHAVRADGGDHLPDGRADVVLLNPPFHQGGTVHTGIATKLMRSAARLLRPGGTLVCVWNSHLRYRPRLERIVGDTRQLARDRTFTVTASVRRG